MKNFPSTPTTPSTPRRPRLTRYRQGRQLVFARHMRREPTRSEALLFALLRKNAGGFRVRRQVVVGRFIVDLLVPSVGLVIEIDGSVHHARADFDRLRQQALEALGYRVVRLSARDVERDPVAVAHQIVAIVRGFTPR